MEEHNVSSGGVGFIGLLQILFIALKLTGTISWTWPVVLLPLLLSCVVLVVLIIVLIIGTR